MSENGILEELEGFLSANFHQDIESIEGAINEFIENVNKKRLIEISNLLKTFLNLGLSEHDKIKLVKEYTFIYFEDGNEYLEFIENILNEMKNKIDLLK